MIEQDLRDTFDRMVAAGPAPTGGTADVLAAARRARRRRSLLTVAGAAVAAVALLVAGSVLLGPTSAAPTAVRPTPTAPAPPTVPGISPTLARKIVAACAKANQVMNPNAESDPAGLELYNAITSPWGMRYLIYGPNTYIGCLHATEGDFRASGREGPTRWLRAPIAVDWSITDGLVPHDKGPGVFSAEGRATSSVATIRVRHGSSAVTVPVVNGTFMVSLSVPAAELGSSAISFQPYDAAGHLLVFRSQPSSDADRIEQERTCWVTPDGTVLPTVLPTLPGQKCARAIRWR
jgi:hypothetical protein